MYKEGCGCPHKWAKMKEQLSDIKSKNGIMDGEDSGGKTVKIVVIKGPKMLATAESTAIWKRLRKLKEGLVNEGPLPPQVRQTHMLNPFERKPTPDDIMKGAKLRNLRRGEGATPSWRDSQEIRSDMEFKQDAAYLHKRQEERRKTFEEIRRQLRQLEQLRRDRFKQKPKQPFNPDYMA